jgi:hypothetical protein
MPSQRSAQPQRRRLPDLKVSVDSRDEVAAAAAPRATPACGRLRPGLGTLARDGGEAAALAPK